jgi:hypothetical protein
MNKLIFLIFVTVVVSYGCKPDDNDAIISPTAAPPAIAPIELPTMTPIKDTLPPLSTEISTLQEPAHEALIATSATVPDANNAYSPRVCASRPQQFNVREALDMSIIQIRFENENLLTFEGWTQGPEPVVTPITPEPTPDMLPGPYIHTRRVLVGGQLSLPEGQFSLRSLDMELVLNNPCGEDCPLEIISQSPNQEWQLVQVHDWLERISGIWLVSKNDMVRIIPYITHLEWQWAIDNSLLWIVYSDPHLGGYTLVAQLGNPVTIRMTGPVIEDLPPLLNPWYYNVAFSPIDKVAISTTSFEFPQLDTDELFTINLTDAFTLTGLPEVIPGVVTVRWNEATQNFSRCK